MSEKASEPNSLVIVLQRLKQVQGRKETTAEDTTRHTNKGLVSFSLKYCYRVYDHNTEFLFQVKLLEVRPPRDTKYGRAV